MDSINIIALSGSLRKASYTTKLAHVFIRTAPTGVNIELVDISQLPLINEDLETDLPEPVRALREPCGEPTQYFSRPRNTIAPTRRY